MLRLIFMVALALGLSGTGAWASFGDCMAEDYLADFGSDEAGANPFGPIRQLTCIIEFDIEYSTPGGTRHIRGIRDASSDWGFAPGALAEVERGARRSIEVMARLGNYRVDDITILILDDEYEPIATAGEGTVGALTNNETHDECLVTSYMLGRAGTPEFVANTTAHEIFHCIQLASLSPEQQLTMTANGAWWTEGSAEYFASLATPEIGDVHNRAGRFAEAVEADVPLHDQSYGMVVFFYWYHERFGIGSLMTFLSGMAPSPGVSAQRQAMRDALSDEEWLEFAEAFADRTITHPNGDALSFGSADGQEYRFERSRTQRIELAPFVLTRGWLDYDCGRWDNTLNPNSANLGLRRESETSWTKYPHEIDARESGSERYRFAAIHTQSSGQSVRVKVERTASCEPCGTSEEIDQCLVGVWTMTGGGAIEWMRANGIPPNLTFDQGPIIMVLEDDGTWVSMPFSTSMYGEFRHRDRVDIVRGLGNLATGGGRWSAEGGQLNTCQDAGGLSGRVSVTSRGGTTTIPINVPGGGQLQQGYSCGETAMQTSLDFPGMSPMSTQYTKVSGPELEE